MTISIKPKILITSNNIENVFELERILSNLDIDTIHSKHGKEILQCSESEEFALSIIDIQIPDAIVCQSIKLLRQTAKNKSLPVIIIAEEIQDNIYLNQIFENGICDLINRPIIPGLLKGKVKLLLEIYSQKNKYKSQGNISENIHQLYQQAIENAHGIPYRFDYASKSYKFLGQGYKYLLGIESPEISSDDLKKMLKEKVHITPKNNLNASNDHISSSTVNIRFYQADFRIKNLNGVEKWINDCSVPMRDEKTGKVIAALGIMQDISDRKKIEQQLRQAQKMEAVGRLAGGVAHDFNNMLTVIRGYSELLLSRFDKNDPIHKKIKQIDRSAEKTEKLTRQLLAFSRQQIMQTEVVNINKIVKNMKDMLIRLIGEDIKLVTDFGTKIGNIKADPGQVEQIIMNLIINARDAMPEGGTIKIKTERVIVDEQFVLTHNGSKEGEFIRLSLSDSGIGMSEDIQTKIFDPFFTTKDEDKGTGLGLSTVYGIVKQSNAYIWVDSERGAGSTFHIQFPYVRDKLEKSRTVKTNQTDFNGKETILLVEDEFDVRSLVRESLQFYGYNILETDNGKKALEMAIEKNDQIDLVLTDLVMPEMSGKEFGEKLKKNNPNIKILYMSGYTDSASFQNQSLDKNSDYIHKPFAPMDIAKKIRQILDKN